MYVQGVASAQHLTLTTVCNVRVYVLSESVQCLAEHGSSVLSVCVISYTWWCYKYARCAIL